MELAETDISVPFQAVLATGFSLVIGLALAYTMARHRFRGRETLDALVTLPIVLPPTVLGYYLLVLIGRNSVFGEIFEKLFGTPLVFTWQAAVLAAMLHSIPLLVRSSRAALEGVTPSPPGLGSGGWCQWLGCA
mgnify:CR=1 FL=1